MQTDKTSLRKCLDAMKAEPRSTVYVAVPPHDPDAGEFTFTWIRRSSYERDMRFVCNGQAIQDLRAALEPARNIKGKAGDAVRDALKVLEGQP